MSARSVRIGQIIVGAAMALTASGCGGGQTQAASEPRANFPVSVSTASFPSSQRLSEHTRLIIAVRNAGERTIPDVAVTICNVTCSYPAPKGQGTSSQAFAADISQDHLANPSRPLWIVDRGPGACSFSCENGGPGGAVTAYSNTWALGRLPPGRTARFQWSVTAVRAGRHVVAWEVAAGLSGRARAVLSDGSPPRGTFAVRVHAAPARSYVDNSGQIVSSQ